MSHAEGCILSYSLVLAGIFQRSRIYRVERGQVE